MAETRPVVGTVPEGETGATLDDLAGYGFDSEVRELPPGRYLVEDQTFHEEATAAGIGALVGLVVGGLLGAVVALAVPALREVGLAAQLALIVGFAFLGTLPGIVTGLQTRDQFDDDPTAYLEVGPDDHVEVVIARGHSAPRAHRLLRRRGTRTFLDPHGLT